MGTPEKTPAQLKQQQRSRKRLRSALILTILVHVLLYLLAPYIELPEAPQSPTEVVQISPEELARIKKQILAKNKFLPPVLENEMHEEFKTKEVPLNAKHMGKFNQKVPEQTVAGAQRDAPGGGSQSPQQPQQKRSHPLRLADLGVKARLDPPPPAQPNLPRSNTPFRPVGRDDKSLKRGNQNLLDTVESEYYSFFSRFEEPLIRNWYFLSRQRDREIHQQLAARRAQIGDELPVTIGFTIDRAGNFVQIAIEQSSGIRDFDDATRDAVRKLGSLPNPPPGIFEGQPTFSYHMTFTLVVTSGVGLGDPAVNWY